jgi:hypothetical protein
VEVDESAYGGKPRATHTREGTAYTRRSAQPTILAMVERGGRVRPKVIPDRTTHSIWATMKRHVLPSSMLFTDEWGRMSRSSWNFASAIHVWFVTNYTVGVKLTSGAAGV